MPKCTRKCQYNYVLGFGWPTIICCDISLFKGYYDIAYSFLIDSNGVVYEGRGWNTEGGHTCGFNKQSYAICFIGNFMDALPDKLALKGTYKIGNSKIEIHILSLHRIMKNSSYFNVCEARRAFQKH